MKKRGLKGYWPVLIMAACAVVLGVLTLSGTLDLNRLPELIHDHCGYCDACFSGNYPIKRPTEDIRGEHEEFKRGTTTNKF